MAACPVCQHAKVESINAALDSGRSPKLISHQFVLDLLSLNRHIVHRSLERKGLERSPSGIVLPNQALRVSTQERQDLQADRPELSRTMQPLLDKGLPPLDTATMDEDEPPLDTPISALQKGLSYVRQAVRLAGDDRLMQERIVALLNEVLQSESMRLC